MIARLRHRVGVYAPQTTPDELGGEVTSWPFWSAVWADIRMVAPQQTFENGRSVTTVRYRAVIRFKDNFPERARLIWGEKTLRVVAGSDPDGRRERLHLMCEEEQE